MHKKFFFLGFWLILIFSFGLRMYLVRNNNFYFTMDQGNDAVHVREIWARHQLLLMGPPTSIPGFYDGALWYYFLTPGYLLFDGHPFGGVFMVILLSLGLTAYIMISVKNKLTPRWALLIGFSLQFFWPFFETSRYAFNPFFLITCTMVTIFLLTDAWTRKKIHFIIAGIFVALPFHTELASFPPLFTLYILVGMYGILKNKWSSKVVILGLTIISIFFLPHLFLELTNGFPQYHAIYAEFASRNGVFSHTNVIFFTKQMINFLGQNLIRQNLTLGSLLFLIVTVCYIIFDQGLVHRSENNHTHRSRMFVRQFTLLTFLLLIFSWIWFSSNKGWSPWHTVYVPPLIFLSALLMLSRLPPKLILFLYVCIMISQIQRFSIRFAEYNSTTGDASILRNELKAIDWIYQKSDGKGPYVYTYLPSVHDYPYQYLFWWYGRKQYDYVPCEYSTYPKIPDLSVPGLPFYQEPKRPCQNLRFLIIEPARNIVLQNQWLEGVRKNSVLEETQKIGTITVEKRRII